MDHNPIHIYHEQHIDVREGIRIVEILYRCSLVKDPRSNDDSRKELRALRAQRPNPKTQTQPS
jgi:hypothetical protein